MPGEDIVGRPPGYLMGSDLDRAYAHCRRVAKEHAKNFYYAFRTLPREKRRAIYAAYAFCRHCDDIADEDLPHDEKMRLFADTRRRLTESQDGSAQDPVFMALGDAAKAFGIPAEYFEQIIEGVEMDLTKTRFQDFDELKTYCYHVASVVGLVCIEVFEYEDQAAKEHAVDLGIAMQLTNIIRDVKEDADRGRIYIPQDEIRSFGYSEEELLAGVSNDSFKSLMEFQADRARRYFEGGSRLIGLLPSHSKACPAVLQGLYSALLTRIEDSGFDVFDRRIALSGPEKAILAGRLWLTSRLPTPRFVQS